VDPRGQPPLPLGQHVDAVSRGLQERVTDQRIEVICVSGSGGS
jgi:hypothetical protein